MPVLAFFALFVPCVQAAADAIEPNAVRAWFTDAVIDGSWQGSNPADALPDAPGTAGSGVFLERSVPVENPPTSPDGVRESFRIDRTYIFNPDETKREDEPYFKDTKLYDGGFPVNEPITVRVIIAER